MEYVAVLARLFASCTVRPVLEPGEDVDGARRRILGLIEDSCQGLLIHVREPEKAALVWERRS